MDSPTLDAEIPCVNALQAHEASSLRGIDRLCRDGYVDVVHKKIPKKMQYGLDSKIIGTITIFVPIDWPLEGCVKLEFWLFWIGVFGVALLLAGIMRTRLVQIFLDRPDPRKVHQRQVPRLGGFGVILVFLSVLVGGILWGKMPMYGLSIVLGVGALVFLLIGMLDDSSLVYFIRRWRDQRRGITYTDPKGWFLRVRSKFLLEFGLVAFAFLFLWPGLGWVVFAVGVVWIIGVSNSFNIIDGIDGLCGSISLWTMLALAFLGYRMGVPEVMQLALLLAGCAVGFLILNHHPAQLFMGDMGSLFFGFSAGILGLWLSLRAPQFDPLSLFYLAGLPVLDVFAAMVRRFFFSLSPGASIKQRLKCMVGADSNHMHHRLLAQGLNHAQSTFVLGILSLSFLFAGVLILELPMAAHIYIHVYMAMVVVLSIAGLFYTDRLKNLSRFLRHRLFVPSERSYRIAVFSGGPLLDQALKSSNGHPFHFVHIRNKNDWNRARGLVDALIIEQGEQGEPFDQFLERIKDVYAESDVPGVVLSQSPLAIASILGDGVPIRTISLPNRPLYIHPVLMHLAHMVGAATMVIPDAEPVQEVKAEVVCANS